MKNRILACLLLALLLSGVLSGCGKNAAKTEEASMTSRYFYQTEFRDLNIDEAWCLQGVDRCCISGGYAFFCGTCVTGTKTVTNRETGEPSINEATGEPYVMDVTETALFRMDLETGETVKLDYQMPALPEEAFGWSYISYLGPGDGGTIWVAENICVFSYNLPKDSARRGELISGFCAEEETFSILSQYDDGGKLLRSLNLRELGELHPQQILLDAGGNFYINDGSEDSSICILDAEGALVMRLENHDFQPLARRSETEIGIIAVEPGGGSCFQQIDPVRKGYGGKTSLLPNVRGVYPGFGEYQYLCEIISGTVFGFREETGEFEKLFAWLDSDVVGSRIQNFTIAENGAVTAVTYQISGTEARYGLLFMEPVDPSMLPQKQELTVAVMGTDSTFSQAVAEFNQAHSSVRIVVKDYSEYNTSEDITAGVTRLNTEILAGHVPDLICTRGLPVDQYAARGFLTDLWPLIDGDENIGREDLMTHLFDAASIDGKLYQIMPSFGISTAVGDAGVLGDRTGWTLDEMLEMMEAMPDASEAFGKNSQKEKVLSYCVAQNLGNFIDWENQTCSFDSDAFREILTFANSFPSEFKGDAGETTRDRFLAGKQLLMPAPVSDFDYMQVISAMTGGDPCYVGYPASAGSGSAFYISSGYAITSACRDVDAAWSFLRTFLTERYQANNPSGFPSNRHAFEALAKKKKMVHYENRGSTAVKTYSSTYSILSEDLTVEIWPLSQEDYDTFLRLYDACDSVRTDNSIVESIIQQETAPFFDGQKTMDEVIELIQNRVGLYVMEQK